MNDDFFNFVKEPDKDAFLKARRFVVSHKDYDPYSDDLEKMEGFLDQGNYDAVTGYQSINTLLSPSAHFYKKYAFEKKGMVNEANAESLFSHRILENIALTGNGGEESPYVVTRISDERDFLGFLGKDFKRQGLVSGEGKYYDAIETSDGGRIYFDITDCYLKLQAAFAERTPPIAIPKGEPWWKFWK